MFPSPGSTAHAPARATARKASNAVPVYSIAQPKGAAVPPQRAALTRASGLAAPEAQRPAAQQRRGVQRSASQRAAEHRAATPPGPARQMRLPRCPRATLARQMAIRSPNWRISTTEPANSATLRASPCAARRGQASEGSARSVDRRGGGGGAPCSGAAPPHSRSSFPTRRPGRPWLRSARAGVGCRYSPRSYAGRRHAPATHARSVGTSGTPRSLRTRARLQRGCRRRQQRPLANKWATWPPNAGALHLANGGTNRAVGDAADLGHCGGGGRAAPGRIRASPRRCAAALAPQLGPRGVATAAARCGARLSAR